MAENAFMDDDTFSAMEAAVAEPEQPVSTEAEPDQTTTTEDTTVASSDDSPETEETEAPDVKQTGPEGWVPRSVLNRANERFKEIDTELQDLRQFRDTYQPDQKAPPPAVPETSDLDKLIADIWPEGTPETVDNNLLNHVMGLTNTIADMKQSRQTEKIQAIQEGWAREIEETNAYFKKTHGIEIPTNFVLNGVVASQGSKSPHTVMEEYLQWHQGLTKAEAKEVVEDAVEAVEDATPATSRKGKGKRSPSQSSKKRKVPDSIAEASRIAAEALGV